MEAIRAIIGKNWLGQYYIAIDDGQTQSLYWGYGSMGDAILSIAALLDEYPALDNRADLQRLYDGHCSDDADELDTLERAIATDYPGCWDD